jgi:hypothetical protein
MGSVSCPRNDCTVSVPPLMESNCPLRGREVPAAAVLPWPGDVALWPAVDDVERELDDADDVEPEPNDAEDVAPASDGAEDGGFPTVSAALICAFCDEPPPKPPLPKEVPLALVPVLDCGGLYAAKSF